MTIGYLSWAGGSVETFGAHTGDGPVDLLVSFVTLKDFLRQRHRCNIGKLMLDSGAYSAHSSGAVINLDDYMHAARELEPDEIIGLDVIGDYRGGIRNLEKMWDAGLPAMPTWHPGEPWDVLTWAKANAPLGKMAFGSRVSMVPSARRRTMKWWLQQGFARVWPMEIHGFAMFNRRDLGLFPFHSVDSSSWCYAPSAMGTWHGYRKSDGNAVQLTLGTKGYRNFWVEVVAKRRLLARSASTWRKELTLLEGIRDEREPWSGGCSVRWDGLGDAVVLPAEQ